MKAPVFLTLEQIQYIQECEMSLTKGISTLRNEKGLKAATAAPQATYNSKYLMNLFEMAATYITSISIHHPYLDGNKRTAAGSAITFLLINGYQLNENYPEELADIILEFLKNKITKDDLAIYFETNCIKLK